MTNKKRTRENDEDDTLNHSGRRDRNANEESFSVALAYQTETCVIPLKLRRIEPNIEPTKSNVLYQHFQKYVSLHITGKTICIDLVLF